MTTASSTPASAAIHRAAITRLVHGFYDDVRADDVLGPTFEAVIGERWGAHLPRMVEFWSTVMLGTRSFSGNVFARHMVVPGVTPLHFTRWLTLWLARTDALFDPATAAELQQLARGIARNLFRGYFGHGRFRRHRFGDSA